MANTKISALADGSPLQAGDEIPIARSGSNFSILGSSVLNLSPSFSSAGSGWLWYPYGGVANVFGTSGGVVASSANRIHLTQMIVPYQITVRNVVFNLQTLSAGGNWGIGLYNLATNSLLINLIISTAATGIKSTAITALSLSPGVYWMCWACDNTTAKIEGTASVLDTAIMNGDGVIRGGFISAGGVWSNSTGFPASLVGATYSGTALTQPITLFTS